MDSRAFYNTLTNAHPRCEAGYWKMDADMAALQSIQEVNFGMPPWCFLEKHFSYKSEAGELCERGAERENWCIAHRTHSWLRPQVFRCVLQVIVNAFQHQYRCFWRTNVISSLLQTGVGCSVACTFSPSLPLCLERSSHSHPLTPNLEHSNCSL